MPSSVSSSSTQSQPRSHVSKLSKSHHADISRPVTPLTNGTGKPNGHRDVSTPSSLTRKPSDHRQLVADRLSILNSILQPLPPTLPLSPPLSPKRLKRKSLEDDDVPSLGSADSGVKRARLSAEASPPSHSRHSSTHAQNSEPRAVSPNNGNAASQSAVKKEEGELEESPSVSRVASSSRANGVNVHRQPRQRRIIDPSAFGKLSEAYQMNAKQLKRSATKRRSPNGNSPQGIEFVASLEDTDSILHFAYSFWAIGQQNSRGSSSQLLKTWESIQDYISFVNRAWEKLLSGASDPERIGRIKMVMALLNLIRYSAWYQVYRWHSNRLRQANENISANSPGNRNSASPPGFQPTPPYNNGPMPPPAQNTAPSPASSSPPGGQANNHRGQPAVGESPQHPSPSGPTVSVPVDVLTTQSRMLHAQDQMMRAQSHYSAELTLFNIYRLFPKAYEVCVGNAPNNYIPLTPGRRDDHHAVDPEACGKGEGDWAWPPVSGDDVVHAVGFGRSILREFGEHYGGYKGLEGTLK